MQPPWVPCLKPCAIEKCWIPKHLRHRTQKTMDDTFDVNQPENWVKLRPASTGKVCSASTRYSYICSRQDLTSSSFVSHTFTCASRLQLCIGMRKTSCNGLTTLICDGIVVCLVMDIPRVMQFLHHFCPNRRGEFAWHQRCSSPSKQLGRLAL